MTIYIAFYNLTTKVVSSSKSVETTVGVTPPSGEAYVVTTELITYPAYYKAGAILPVPTSADPGLVWDAVNEVWQLDFPILVKDYLSVIEAISNLLYSAGFFYVPPGASSPWIIVMNSSVVNRINAMVQKLTLSPPGALPMKVFGAPASENFQTNPRLFEQVVTREQAAEFCLLFAEHVEKTTRQKQYQLTGVRKAELLHATDPTTALDNLVDLIDAGWLVDPPLFT